MKLIVILIAVVLDRTLDRKPQLYFRWYANRYVDWLSEKKLLSTATDSVSLSVAILLPVLLTLFVTAFLPGLIQFFLECFIVFIVLRQVGISQQFHAYQQAAQRQDDEACFLLAQKWLPSLTAKNRAALGREVGRELAWINFQFYGAVIIWYAAFGIAGVVLFALVREWQTLAFRNKNLPLAQLSLFLEWLNFVPARLTAACYLFVGDFTRAMPAWLNYLTNVSVSARYIITHVATKAIAEDDKGGESPDTERRYVELAKRATKTLVVVVAFLTIIGLVD